MGDSTGMTIEFLRARLLSERSVSRAARERADQMAKRVMELEEQLRMVTMQRKKAEKAASEVLAILESQGISDLSEITDSSSEQDDETPCGLKDCDDALKDEISTASKMDRNEVEDELSGSELEVSPSQIGSLSWKGRSKSPDSSKKHKTKLIRQRQRHSSFMSSTEPSPKYHLGKSCRKIKRNETGPAEDKDADKPLFNAPRMTEATRSHYADDQPEFSVEVSKKKLEKVLPDSSMPCSLNDENKEVAAVSFGFGRGRDEEMDRVLEQQAQLIGRYQAEENAQREWERKFNENKSSIPSYCQSVDQPHTYEDSAEPKDEATQLLNIKPYEDMEAISSATDTTSIKEPTAENLPIFPVLQPSIGAGLDKTGGSQEAGAMASPDGFVPIDLSRLAGGSNSQAFKHGLLSQHDDKMAFDEVDIDIGKFALSDKRSRDSSAGRKQNQGQIRDNFDIGSPSKQSVHTYGQEINKATSIGTAVAHTDSGRASDSESPGMKKQLQMQLSEAPSNSLVGVFEALHHAKLSLKQELCKLPLPSQGTFANQAPTGSHGRANASGDAGRMPIGSTSLFRLPTDTPPVQISGHEMYGSRLSLTASYPRLGYAAIPNDYQYPATSYAEPGVGAATERKYFNTYHSGVGVPASSRYSLSYSGLTREPPPFPGGVSKPHMDMRNGLLADKFSSHTGDGRDGPRSNMRMW